MYDSKYSGYLLESGAMALETAMPIMLTWQKSGKINQVLSKTSGVTEEELVLKITKRLFFMIIFMVMLNTPLKFLLQVKQHLSLVRWSC